ncbi:hypothetical protein MHF_1142 [Mycoplasma haemofelis Ohio2]|uniref:Uncharacterized protein n=1 Tax=Mycoplasma haemofelis (strain Ohio2) TaxID=859194 RepID=F6FJN0_MYCHI|nr:hypothetical protein MHF_1142 [Mycoplasma haemofelis Ohio2]
MAYSKILALGGLTAASGGVAGGAFLSSSKGKAPEASKTISPVSTKGKETVEAPKEKKCFIYVAENVNRRDNTVELTHISQKVEGAEKFLEGKQTSNGKFEDDVRKACSGEKEEIDKTKESLRVYVYQSGGSWVYAQVMQTQDWASQPNIITNSGIVLKS